VDPSYRYGSTQNGQREPHHGVEFYSAYGTPVMAAASGEVVFAGQDDQTKIGLYKNFYGNLVILRHDQLGLSFPLFTLYGHLSKIEVVTGQKVTALQEIGQVGASGAAIGSHLHFEVRQAINSYENTRNPELWLKPLASSDGQQTGVLAIRLFDISGKELPLPQPTIQRFNPKSGDLLSSWFPEPYAKIDPSLNPDGQYHEQVVVGDLPVDTYRVSLVAESEVMEKIVEIKPGQLTLLTFGK
jgi:murein DD-endopeptidase MepM/ murein hydrolase activator NlpD